MQQVTFNLNMSVIHSQSNTDATETYAMGTMMFGNNGYIDSQSEHCECVPESEFLAHYEKLLHQFYSVYAP